MQLRKNFDFIRRQEVVHLVLSINARTLLLNKYSLLNLYLSFQQGKKRKRRWTTLVRNQIISNFSRHKYNLSDEVGIPKLHDYGSQNQRNYMMIQLLDHSLEDLFNFCDKKFSLGCIFGIGVQIITRLQQIHRKGFIHRDIKANNFMNGCGGKEQTRLIYIIDFGLAKKYRDSNTGQHIPMKTGKSLVGTARYASIASHEGVQQCRRDDLQSLGYLLLYFLMGKLPWQGIQINSKIEKYQQIGRMKKQAKIAEICGNFHQDAMALARYFQVVKQLGYQQQPPYDNLRKIFREVLIRRGQSNCEYSWQRIQYPRREKKLSK